MVRRENDLMLEFMLQKNIKAWNESSVNVCRVMVELSLLQRVL